MGGAKRNSDIGDQHHRDTHTKDRQTNKHVCVCVCVCVCERESEGVCEWILRTHINAIVIVLMWRITDESYRFNLNLK